MGLVLASEVIAQDDILDRRVNIDLVDVRVEDALEALASKTRINISYNAAILNADSVITLRAKDVAVGQIVKTILGESIRYKVVGSHLVLTGFDSDPKSKDRYVITGYITDKRTGKKLHNASIYVSGADESALTDHQGFYEIFVSSRDRYVGVNFSKHNYLDTVIVVRPQQDMELIVSLARHEELFPAPSPEFEARSSEIDSLPLVRFLVPEKQSIWAKNQKYLRRAGLQFSVIPSISTNKLHSGSVTNHFSLNLFAGYSSGLAGVEMGGMLNMLKGDMLGVQAAGLGNISGGEAKGVQLAGLFNNNRGSVYGLQAAGFSNTVLDTVSGVQLAGFSNIAMGQMTGVQAAGFANVSTGSVNGAQISGFANVARGSFEGTQISGFLNYAKKVNGSQIGIVNINDTASGMMIGFINWSRTGYHRLEVSSNDMMYLNLAFKSGINRFYNIFKAGIRPTNAQGDFLWSFGYGIGFHYKLGEVVFVNLEPHAIFVTPQDFVDEFHIVSNLDLNLGFQLSPRTAIYGGPSLRVQTTQYQDPSTGEYGYGIEQSTFFEDTNHGTNIKAWFGFSAGLLFF
jgi:hypothetical protein